MRIKWQKTVTILALLTGVVFANENRIINGYEINAPIPFLTIVSMKYNASVSSSTCGGAIVSTTVIVTAAHCFHFTGTNYLLDKPEFTNKVTVYGGHVETDKLVALVVKRVWIHENYNAAQKFASDIALVQVKEIPPQMSPIPLPNPKTVDQNVDVWTAGWGQTFKVDSCLTDQHGPQKLTPCHQPDQGCQKGEFPQTQACRDFFQKVKPTEAATIFNVFFSKSHNAGPIHVCYKNENKHGWCYTSASKDNLSEWGFCLPSCAKEPTRKLKGAQLRILDKKQCNGYGSFSPELDLCLGGFLSEADTACYDTLNGKKFRFVTTKKGKPHAVVGYKGLFRGDSGTPIWIKDPKSGQEVLVGIARAAPPTLQHNLPDVALKVKKFTDWIYDKVSALDKMP